MVGGILFGGYNYTRTAVIGDIGGQLDVFEKTLNYLGVVNGIIPADLQIIQVGDLIRNLPIFYNNNNYIIESVSNILEKSGDQWVQLLGNHEAVYLGGISSKTWDTKNSINSSSLNTLLNWWNTKQITLSSTLFYNQQELLITHAGLSVGLWKELEKVNNASDMAYVLNNLSLPGSFLGRDSVFTNGVINISSDILWAQGPDEIYLPWMKEQIIPFGQIHGHQSLKKSGIIELETFNIAPTYNFVNGLIGEKHFISVDQEWGNKIISNYLPPSGIFLNNTI